MKEKKCIMSLAVKKRMAILVSFVLLLSMTGLLLHLHFSANRVKAYTREEREKLSQNMNEIHLSVAVHEEDGTLAVRQEILFTNRTGNILPDLVLRTYANAFLTEETSPAAIDEVYDVTYGRTFSPGGIHLMGIWWQDEIIPFSYLDEAKTVLRLETGKIAPGENGKISLNYVIQVPECRYRFGRTEESWQLGNVFPMPSLWEKDHWRQDPYYPVGDPFVSESAVWKVSLLLPEGWQAASSAELKETEKNRLEGEILCARDFALVLLPEGRKISKQFGDVRVTVLSVFDQEAKKALNLAGKILEVYSGLYGPYPYDSLTVCQISFPFGGMEYPACIFAEKTAFTQKGDALEQLLAHEIAHQWFYALAGSDQILNPWQDEGICQWAVLSYIGEAYGPDSRERMKYYYLEAPMEEKILSDVTPGSPIHYFPDYDTYSSVVYGRGAAFIQALDLFTKGRINEFLKDYCQKNPFGLYTRENFEKQLADFTGEDISPLMTDFLDTLMQ